MMWLAQEPGMGLEFFAPWANAGVIGVMCAIFVWHFIRSPKLEAEKVKADREWQTQCDERRVKQEDTMRSWHAEQIETVTDGVKDLAASVRTLADKVHELPCRTHNMSAGAFPGGSWLQHAESQVQSPHSS